MDLGSDEASGRFRTLRCGAKGLREDHGNPDVPVKSGRGFYPTERFPRVASD